MQRLNFNDTCPVIDDAIAEAEDVGSLASEILDLVSHDNESVDIVFNDAAIKELCDQVIKRIVDANERIRDTNVLMRNQADKQIEELSVELSDAESEIDSLKYEIESLEGEIDSLKYKIEELEARE